MSGDNAKKNSYEVRSAANSRYNSIYQAMISGCQLESMDRIELRSRGLTDQQIDKANYGTKKKLNTKEMQKLLHELNTAYDLKGVPGFYLNKDKRSMQSTPGIVLPMRDISGSIQFLKIRNADPKGNNKYVSFSTPPKDAKFAEGGGARNIIHCPIIHSFNSKQEMGTTLRLTEGVLKADVAAALDSKIYTVGMPGLEAPDDLHYILEQLEISTILLAFDMEESVQLKAKRLKLYKELSANHDVKIEAWNKDHKGIDDALLKDPGSVHILPQDEVDKLLETTNRLDPFKSGYIYIVRTEQFIHQTNFDVWSHSQFSSMMYMGGPSDILALLSADNPVLFPRCQEMEFAPAMPPVFEENNSVKFNTWRPNPIESVEGDVSLFTDHMEYLFPDAMERHHLLQWITHQVQFPGEKIHFAALIRGMPGIGKSFIGYLMDVLLGKHNIARPSNEDLHEKYSSWEKNCQLVVVEEVMAEGRMMLMNKLKPKITEPVTRVREMHKSSYDQPNRYNMMLLTNYKNSLPIELDDRRYLVMFSPALPQSPKYYRELFSWSKTPENAAALLHWAQHYDLEGFEAKGHAPKTSGRKEMIDLSKAPFEQFVESCLDERTWPFNSDIVSLNDISNSKELPARFQHQGAKRWAALLEDLGARSLGQLEIVKGSPKRHVWAVRRAEFWMKQELADKRHEYGKWQGNAQPGGNAADENFPMSA